MTAFPLSPLVPPPQNIWLPFFLLRKCWPVLSQSTSGPLFLFNCWYSLSSSPLPFNNFHPPPFSPLPLNCCYPPPSLSLPFLRVHFPSNARLRSSNRHRFAVSWNSRRLRNSSRHRFVTLWNSSPLRNTLRSCLREVQALSPTTPWSVRISSVTCLDTDIHTCCILQRAHYSHTFSLMQTTSLNRNCFSRDRHSELRRSSRTANLQSRETTTIINRCCKHPKRLRG